MSEQKLELKPCPFCGGEAAFEQTGRRELTLRCVGLQPSGLRGCGPKYVQKVKTHSLEWLAGAMAESWNQRTPFVDCECTKVVQDKTCPVGYVALDGPELWEIVFGVNSDAASDITDEQYDKIAKAINDVFVAPLRAAIPTS